MNIAKDERIRFNPQSLTTRRRTTAIVLHHACMYGDAFKIHQVHLNNGWAGIGYHYYIRQDGKVYAGRPQFAVGSHCKGYNYHTLGVCLEGDFRTKVPTTEQINTMNKLIDYLKETYAKQGVQELDIFNHKDLFNTACPVVDLKHIYKQYKSKTK